MNSSGWNDWGAYKKGELVQVRTPAVLDQGAFILSAGVVVDYWPSNVYERATYEVLIDGEVVHVDPRNLSTL